MTLSAWTAYVCFTLISRFLPWFSLCTAAPPPQKIVSLPDFVWGEEAAVQRLKTWTRKGKFRLPSLPPTRKSRMGKWHSLAFAKLPIIIDFVGRGLLFHFILSVVFKPCRGVLPGILGGLCHLILQNGRPGHIQSNIYRRNKLIFNALSSCSTYSLFLFTFWGGWQSSTHLTP